MGFLETISSMLPSCFTVETDKAQSLFSEVKLNKSVDPDGISHKLLIELSNYIAAILAAVINS